MNVVKAAASEKKKREKKKKRSLRKKKEVTGSGCEMCDVLSMWMSIAFINMRQKLAETTSSKPCPTLFMRGSGKLQQRIYALTSKLA